MQKKRLNKEQRSDIAALAAMKDSEIDLTDLPEVLDWSEAEVGRYYRKKKTSTCLRTEGKRKRIR
jgi:hypothetical protein